MWNVFNLRKFSILPFIWRKKSQQLNASFWCPYCHLLKSWNSQKRKCMKSHKISFMLLHKSRKTICIIILMSMKLSILKVMASDSDIFYIFAFLDSTGSSCFSDRCSDWAILQFDCLVDSIHMFLSTDWNSSFCSCVQGNDVTLCYLSSKNKFIGCFVGS